MIDLLIAVGSTESLSARYAAYEVHFTCRTRDEIVKARALMALIPGSSMADDVATRFEVPSIESENGVSLGQLFNTLSSHNTFTEYTVEKATLESVFLKVIRENNVREEDNDDPRHRSWWKVLGVHSLGRWWLKYLRCSYKLFLPRTFSCATFTVRHWVTESLRNIIFNYKIKGRLGREWAQE